MDRIVLWMRNVNMMWLHEKYKHDAIWFAPNGVNWRDWKTRRTFTKLFINRQNQHMVGHMESDCAVHTDIDIWLIPCQRQSSEMGSLCYLLRDDADLIWGDDRGPPELPLFGQNLNGCLQNACHPETKAPHVNRPGKEHLMLQHSLKPCLKAYFQ